MTNQEINVTDEMLVQWALEWKANSQQWADLEQEVGYDGPPPEEAILNRRRRSTGYTAVHYAGLSDLGKARRDVKRYLSSWAQGLLKGQGRVKSCEACGAKTSTKYCSPACQRRGERLRLYGMTPEQFQAMVEEQGGRCKICRTADPGLGRTGKARQWSIDHDHACCPQNPAAGEGALCGKCNRGLLCSRCNTGLGYFRDSIEVLEAAAEYLRAWESPGRSL